MKFNKYFKIGFSIFVVVLFLFISFSSVMGNSAESELFTDNNHVKPSIWDLTIKLNKPEKALVLTLEQKQWQALAAICVVPAFIDRSSSTPLMFSDGVGDISTVIPHDKKAVTSWGSDASSASAMIAKEYWSKAELVFAVEKYEEALWTVPSAAFLSAPILVSPTKDTLNSLGTKIVIAIGNTNVQTDNIIKITTKEEVWTFQLELFDTKGVACNYVILTNPHDTEDNTPENIKWKYQSPAAAILAAYRHGIVQTGDWSVDRAAFEKIEIATDPDETNYDKIKPGFTKLKEDSYAVEKFLQDHGHTPEYLAAVGGPYAVPNFVYDIHVDYYYPTKNPQKTQYPSSLAAYATLTQTTDEAKYTKEDLAAGRLAAGNTFDLTKQLMRTFFYQEFLADGKYYSQTPNGWEKKSCFVDGHRLNQPEPDSLMWEPNKHYYPYEGINPVFENAGLSEKYYLPRNNSDPLDANKTIGSIMKEETPNYGYFHFMPHGGLTKLRIEVGIEPLTGEGEDDWLNAATISEVEYKAPSLIYTTCCKGGVWMLDKSTDGLFEPSDFITSSFIHAGAVVYIATPEIQSACFWKEAPYSVAGTQAIEFWKNVFSDNVPIGKAWRDAKWTAHNTWESKTPKPESPLTHHVDCISYTLFGDPALEIYKPKISFSSIKDMDIDIKITKAETGEDFTVEVIIKDLETGTTISDATVKITFQGTEHSGPKATFSAPTDAGENQITVKVNAKGYKDTQTKTWHQVGEVVVEDEEEPKDQTAAWIGVGILILIIIIVISGIIIKGKKKT